MSDRIKGKKIDISEKEVQSFFRDRAIKNRDESVNRYQPTFFLFDTDPELALKRDVYEKQRFLQVIGIDDYQEDGISVLEIGCGEGRWGDLLRTKGISRYVGVDFSSELVESAATHFKELGDDRFTFFVGKFQELDSVLDKYGLLQKYDLIIITGVFMYINDSEVGTCMEQLNPLLGEGTKLYLNNPVGLQDRMTLKDFYSEDMKCRYNAIYRTVQEYQDIIDTITQDYEITVQEYTYPEGMRNRKETADYHWVVTIR